MSLARLDFVFTACFTAASTTQLDTAHLTDLDGDATAIILHDSLGQRQHCMRHPVPPWARPLLLAYLQRFIRTDLPLLAADPLTPAPCVPPGHTTQGLTGPPERETPADHRP